MARLIGRLKDKRVTNDKVSVTRDDGSDCYTKEWLQARKRHAKMATKEEIRVKLEKFITGGFLASR